MVLRSVYPGLVGKALVVYWPSGYAIPWPKFIRNAAERHGQRGLMRILKTLIQLRWVPNVGQMRYIYGGGEDPLAQAPAPAPSPPAGSSG